MRRCPSCGNEFPDDANFCPMDATKLLEPAAAVAPASDRTLSDAPPPIAGRFLLRERLGETPLGPLGIAEDLGGGGQVLLQQVEARSVPTAALADRALRE